VDACHTIDKAPLKAQAATAEEAQQAREEAAPESLRGRVAKGEALPRVEVAMPRRTRRSSQTEVERELLQHVVGRMKEDCFIGLLQLMRLR
jgi:hypothetical protein